MTSCRKEFIISAMHTDLDRMGKFMCNGVRDQVKDELKLEVSGNSSSPSRTTRSLTRGDLFETLANTQAVIYGNTRRMVDFHFDQLRKRNFKVSIMHADFEPKGLGLTVRESRSGSARSSPRDQRNLGCVGAEGRGRG